MGKPQRPTKIASKIPHTVEAQIVEISLQHPDRGARRLAVLLEDEKILVSASAIYNILKRHGLQTRTKRFAKLKEMA